MKFVQINHSASVALPSWNKVKFSNLEQLTNFSFTPFKTVTSVRCQTRKVQAMSNNLNTREGNPSLECVNPFKDDWEFVLADGERLETNPSDINKFLLSTGAEAVRAGDALRLMQEQGWTMLDLRIQWSKDEFYLPEAVHLPIFRKIDGTSLSQTFRKIGFATFVEYPPVERNFPNWLEEVQARFPDRSTLLLLACDVGGRLSEDPTKCVFSPSFEAMFYLRNLGYTNLRYIRGGMCAWRTNEELVASTEGVKGTLPWFKKISGIKEFFPSPCGWSYVATCSIEDESVIEISKENI
mmetsp:Transcript_18728/g.25949  ORF Transcript_18728/g.25949 Transcript_18728/m.25949 type:complete len:296 (+) Transcript_18728:103-990(+)